MANKKFTLLELHLGSGTIQIGPATLGGDDHVDDDLLDETEIDLDLGPDDGDESDDGSCPACTAGKLLLLVGGLVTLVVVASKLLGSDEDLDELEDLADLDDAEE